MKVELDTKNCCCTVVKEPGDPIFRNGGWGDAESRLLYHVKNILNARGYDLIKKRMWKDGHLMDSHQLYLRTRKRTGKPDKDIYIWNGNWLVEGAERAFNEDGKVLLHVTTDVFNVPERKSK